jgi:hypothetical protein
MADAVQIVAANAAVKVLMPAIFPPVLMLGRRIYPGLQGVETPDFDQGEQEKNKM